MAKKEEEVETKVVLADEKKETKAKDPMDYTEIELELMKSDKAKTQVYHTIMKARRKIIRAEREAKDDRIIISGAELDLVRKTRPKEYDKLVKKLSAQYRADLLIKVHSSTEYPQEIIREWRMIIKAIERGIWHPTTPQLGKWRPPRAKTAFEKIMES